MQPTDPCGAVRIPTTMNAQIYDEASEWLIELQVEDSDSRMRERFATWLDTSPEHVRAYLEVVSLWEDASGLDQQRLLDVDALMAAAKAERNLFPLEIASAENSQAGVNTPGTRTDTVQHKYRKVAFPALAASTVALLSAALYWNSWLRGLHSTAVGEQRTLALADGTIVELDADTSIRERFAGKERLVELLKGQALFRVAVNVTRPFIVRSDTVTVRVIGTQFDVQRRATGTTVTVLEGRVAVSPTVERHLSTSVSVQDSRLEPVEPIPALVPAPSQNAKGTSSVNKEVLLEAGQQLSLPDRKGSSAPQPADLHSATAWTQQRLIFKSTKLSDAAEEFNRFNSQKLIVDASGLDDFEVSGTFEAFDPKSLERFVKFLRDQQGLSVVESRERITVTKNR